MCRVAYLCCLVLAAESVHAQWTSSPSTPLFVDSGLLPEVCSDSSGGCYISYEVSTVYPRQLFLRRLTLWGYGAWNRVQLLGNFPSQEGAKVIADRTGGAIVAYLDYYSSQLSGGAVRLRIQKVDSSGHYGWDSAGVRASTRDTSQSDEQMVTDGKGGCIVAWFENNDVLIQRVNSAGSRLWGDSGIAVGVLGTRLLPLASDGMGGCVLQLDTVVQRYDSNGAGMWGSNGVSVPRGAISGMQPDMTGGIVGAGMVGISYNNGDPFYAAMAHRIDSAGGAAWGFNGTLLADSLQNTVLNAPAIAVDYLANGWTACEWYRRIGSDTLNTFAQLIRPDGSTVFPAGGLAVSLVPAQYKVGGQWLVNSTFTDVIHIWTDSRTPGGIYAQLLDTSGQRLWGQNDVPVVVGSLGGIRAISDCAGGCILVGWQESNFSVYAQHVSWNGKLGEVIASVGATLRANGPANQELLRNYPNPFNPSTSITYELASGAEVNLKVYDLLGREVAVLVNGRQTGGQHSVQWNAGGLPSGVYCYRLSALGPANKMMTTTKKMTLVR